MATSTWPTGLTTYFVYLIFVSTLGPLLFGYHLSELNTPMDVITCKKKSIYSTTRVSLPQCIGMTELEKGLVTSMFTLGGLMGALAAGPYAAVKGRKPAMHICTVFFIVGPVFEALAQDIGVMAVGRTISGIGAGAAIVCVPIYIAEIAPSAHKGFFGVFTQLMCNVGILIAQLLGYFLSYGQYWRIVLGAGGVIGLIQAAGLFLAVESPRWLSEEGRSEETRQNLRRIRGEGYDIDKELHGWAANGASGADDEAQTLLNQPEERTRGLTGAQNGKRKLGMIQVLRDTDTRGAVIAVVMIMIAQQFTGINSIIMYGVPLLAGLLEANAALVILVVSAVNIIVTAAAAPLVERLGRKTCLLNSMTGMGISSVLLAIGIINKVRILSAVSVILFVGSFGFGLGPVPFMLASELVGPDAVGATQSWALSANWISTFVVAQFFPVANNALGGYVYYLFAALALFFGLFTAWCVPETKGKQGPDEVWNRQRRQD
jgi:sugar porter (SP) family MFS transporter